MGQLKEALLDPALIEIEKQNYDVALMKLQQIIRIYPDSSDIWKEIAICYKQKDMLEDALEALLKARKFASPSDKHFIQSQILLYIQKDGFGARDEINTAIVADPSDVRYYHFRAYIESGLYRDEKDAEKYEDYDRVKEESLKRELEDYEFIISKSYKRMASIINNMGAVYFEKGDHQKALEYFNLSVQTCSYYLQAYFNQALACKEMNDSDKAITIYDTMLSINPAVTRAHTLRGQCFYQKSHYSKAESDFAISLQADKIEMEAIFGYYRSMMKTKKINLVLPVFNRINQKLRQFLENLEGKINSELQTLKLQPESEINSLRIEVRERSLKKLKKETTDTLQLSLRFTAELNFLIGEFSTGLSCISTLTQINPSLKNTFISSLLSEFGTPEFNSISPEVKRLSWEFCCRLSNKTTYRNSLYSLLSTNTSPFIKLTTKEEQIYFISCFSYFYLGLHSTKDQTFQILEDLKKWIYCTPSANQELKLMNSNFNHNINRLCSHPFVLVHILEIFKKTKNNLTLRVFMLKTLLGALYERRSVNELEFETFVTRLIRKTVVTSLPSPYFLIEQ
jgi:tetratricopeptide (TPR) repeat protein